MPSSKFFAAILRGLAPLVLLLGLLGSPGPAQAGEVRVAAAANFVAPAREIGQLFQQTTKHRVRFSFASTSQIYAQIAQGAPFDVFLAADRRRARLAVRDGLAVAGSRFVYATGRLVLYSRDPGRVKGAASLKTADVSRIAIANPATAPYGAAAIEAMRRLGVYDALRPKLVRGNNIAQAYQFVATGNAELGFVALSQVAGRSGGSRWLVPRQLHPAIAQEAVLLTAARNRPAARAFLAFLKGPMAAAVKRKYGYGSED